MARAVQRWRRKEASMLFLSYCWPFHFTAFPLALLAAHLRPSPASRYPPYAIVFAMSHRYATLHHAMTRRRYVTTLAVINVPRLMRAL